ncbi:MAG: LacI family DNA-binding transcriptional regulator [Christiangramia sp.]|uniref:LacI family DNA-binding transcriptional regulator n=1 Tax=Christiangramia sp. TaxID=1931228 RepID=UPI003242ACF2
MNKKRHSLKDIARELNVSVTTVSFVLNGKGKEKKISDEVIKKIQDYTRKINYRPNLVAQSLRTGKTKILVFMVEDISNYFFSKIARIIEDIAYKEDYKVLFCSNENNDDRSRELINLFYERQVDGFIIIPSPGIKDSIQMLINNNIPVVLFDRYFDDLDTNYVVIDNENSTHHGTQHLLSRGYRNIGFITIDVDQIQMKGRLNGYLNAITENKLKSYVLKIPYSETGSKNGKKQIQQFLHKNPDLDAVFFSTNYLTQIGLEVLREDHPRKLQEMGIITFDDNDLFKIYSPSISAVAQPLKKIGKELMKIMMEMLQTDKGIKSTRHVVLDTKLIPRDSSLPKEEKLMHL